MSDDGAAPGRLTAEPLYKRAEAAMLARIADGTWPPGHRLPPETALAEAFGVSQGTLRKAMAALEARGLLARAPGRGTTVARITDEAALYAFFPLRDAAGRRIIPEPMRERVSQGPAGPEEAAALGEGRVWRIERLRAHGGRAFALERMAVPAARFPDLGARAPLPNSLYPFYEAAYGVTVARAEDDLAAVAAGPAEAAALGLALGAPLLRARRVAHDLAERAVELRHSLFLTAAAHYRVALQK